jgi:tetratricopeptide (TPR) repeat protein
MMSRVVPAAALAFAATVALFPAVGAQSPDAEAMVLGNGLYEAGSYSEAVEVYEELVARGIRSGALYYNLGNAYFKLGELGPAVLNYRRALTLNPGDGDIEDNLKLARETTIDQLPAPETGLVNSLSSPTRRLLTQDQTAIAALVFSAALVLLVLGMPLVGDAARRAVRYGVFVAGGLMLLSLAALGGHVFSGVGERGTVVVESEVDLKSGPGEQYASEVTLHSGAEVTTIESRGAWTRLALPVGERQGWVPKRAVERVTIED